MPHDDDSQFCDDRVNEIIVDFLGTRQRVGSSDVEALLGRYPDHAGSLRSFFENYLRLQEFAPDSNPLKTSTFSPPEANTETWRQQAKPEVKAGLNPGPIVPPASFGRYRIERSLGKGGMGVVYLAEDLQLHRKVAIKIPSASIAEDADLASRFEREARAAAILRHPHICTVFDVGEFQGIRFLTMEYIDGAPLSQVISRSKSIPPKKAAAAIRKLALALQHAHDMGIVHRDLKSSNVMVDRSGDPILMDFGLARFTSAAIDVRLTHSGAILGSPAYMSPEHWSGDSEQVGPAADQYCLGIIFYELLTARLPFHAQISQLVQMILLKPPPLPSQFVADLSPHLEQICLKMISKQPSDRYSNLREVADVLGGYLRDPDAPVIHRSTVPNELANVRTVGPGRVADTKPDLVDTFRVAAENSVDAHPKARSSVWPATVVVIGTVLVFIALFIISKPWTSIELSQKKEVTHGPTSLGDEPGGEVKTLSSGEKSGRDSSAVAKDNIPAVTMPVEPPEVPAVPQDSRVQQAAVPNPLPKEPDQQPDREIPFLEVVHEFIGHSGCVTSVWMSADARIAFSAGGHPNGDRTIRKWNLLNAAPLGTVLNKADFVTGISCSPDGVLLFSGSNERALRLWNGWNGSELIRFPATAIATAISQNGLLGYSVAEDGTAFIWDLEPEKKPRRLSGLGNGKVIRLSPDERLVAAGGFGKQICIWNALTSSKDNKPSHVLQMADGSVEDLQFSPDGKLLAAADLAGGIRVFDIETEQQLVLLKGHGKNTPKSETSPARNLIPVTALVFVEEGEFLITAGEDETLRLWHLKTAHEVGRQRVRTGHITTMASTRGTKLVLTGSKPTSVDPARKTENPGQLFLWRLSVPADANP